MKVFLHTVEHDRDDWRNEGVEMATCPSINDYVVWDWRSPWYRVMVVVHVPKGAEYDVEVFAVRDDHTRIIREARAAATSQQGTEVDVDSGRAHISPQ